MQSSHGLVTNVFAAYLGIAAGGLLPTGSWARAPRAASLQIAQAQAAARAALVRATDAEERFRELATALEGRRQAKALSEASRLGILREVARARPSLPPETVRRLGIALVTQAHRHHLDPLLLVAVARVESRFDPYAHSGAGAVGLMQIRPPTGAELALRAGRRLVGPAQLYDVETNVALGARYLEKLEKRYPTLREALLAYNRGPAGARQALSGDTRSALDGYPARVLSERDRLAREALAHRGG